MSKLRNSAHELVQIQVQVFDEKLHCDQAELEKDPLNLSPQQLFDIICTKVREIPISCSSSVSGSDVDLFPVDSTHTVKINLQTPCVLYMGQAFRYSSENTFYIFNQQIYFII